MSKIKLSELEKEKIRHLYCEECCSINKIAKQMNRDWSTIKNYLLKNNIKNTFQNFKIHEDKDIQKLINMYKSGKTSSQIAYIFNVSDTTVTNTLKRHNVPIRNKGIPSTIKSHNYFENINTPNKAYILGFIIADGSIGGTKNNKNRISISQNNINYQVLKDISVELCGYLSNISSYEHKKNKDGIPLISHSFAIHSKKACEDLVKYGVVPNKTHLSYLPKNISIDLMPHLIRGIFDGDGTVYVDKRGLLHFGFYGTNRIVSEIQAFLINEIKITDNKITVQKRANVSFSSYAKFFDVYNFFKYIYPCGDYIYLKRKKMIFEQWLKNKQQI